MGKMKAFQTPETATQARNRKAMIPGIVGPLRARKEEPKLHDALDPLVQDRINTIIELIGQRMHRTTIVRKFMEQTGLGSSAAYEYYNAAWKAIEDERLDSRHNAIIKSIASADSILREARRKGRTREALDALEYGDKLRGIVRSDTNILNVNLGQGQAPPAMIRVKEMTEADLIKMLAARDPEALKALGIIEVEAEVVKDAGNTGDLGQT